MSNRRIIIGPDYTVYSDEDLVKAYNDILSEITSRFDGTRK